MRLTQEEYEKLIHSLEDTIVSLGDRLNDAEKDADALAEELRLEQNPGYTCAALANHEARKDHLREATKKDGE